MLARHAAPATRIVKTRPPYVTRRQHVRQRAPSRPTAAVPAFASWKATSVRCVARFHARRGSVTWRTRSSATKAAHRAGSRAAVRPATNVPILSPEQVMPTHMPIGVNRSTRIHSGIRPPLTRPSRKSPNMNVEPQIISLAHCHSSGQKSSSHGKDRASGATITYIGSEVMTKVRQHKAAVHRESLKHVQWGSLAQRRSCGGLALQAAHW
mmetsp:Transcript_22710/g.64946  ORF Transcript_22710/g.64946 Transcript_22710/m.64946 type:complete len:210 (+) Transcript_22710:2292-2921(+)